MFGSKTPKPNNRIDTLIGAGTLVEGDIHFCGGLRIDGSVKGNVLAEDAGTVVLSEQASVEGEIRAAHAVIDGTVVGPVHASECVALQAMARVTGDVHYKALEVHLGAVVQGRLVHQAEPRAVEKVVALKAGSVE